MSEAWQTATRQSPRAFKNMLEAVEQDPAAPHAATLELVNGRILAAAIPNARLEVFKGGGHLFLLTHGDESVAVLRDEMGDTMEAGVGIYRSATGMQHACDKLAELRDRYRRGVKLDDLHRLWQTLGNFLGDRKHAAERAQQHLSTFLLS